MIADFFAYWLVDGYAELELLKLNIAASYIDPSTLGNVIGVLHCSEGNKIAVFCAPEFQCTITPDKKYILVNGVNLIFKSQAIFAGIIEGNNIGSIDLYALVDQPNIIMARLIDMQLKQIAQFSFDSQQPPFIGVDIQMNSMDSKGNSTIIVQGPTTGTLQTYDPQLDSAIPAQLKSRIVPNTCRQVYLSNVAMASFMNRKPK